MNTGAWDDLNWRKRRDVEAWEPTVLREHQLRRLRDLLGAILPTNAFYQEKLAACSTPPDDWSEFASWPTTSKQELVGNDSPFAANLTFDVDRYRHFHRTSGTTGKPLAVLDTAEDWRWWINAWQFVLDAAELEEHDRAVMAFSYGPFIGFWSAHDAAVARGALVVPSGGMSSVARLDLIQSVQATVVFCTPSYALHLADVAADQQVQLSKSSVSRLIVAGEPGGSAPAIRRRIEDAWGARVVDHSGATEIGPWGYSDATGQGLHVNEFDFYPEFINWKTGLPAQDGELAELVLTTLGRTGCPVIRYRTGDLVRPTRNHPGPNRFALLQGGVLGRVDDMMIIRGVNIFPSSVEEILRGFPEVSEFRLTATKHGAMDSLQIEVEDQLGKPERIAAALQVRLGLRIDVKLVPPSSLPRFEAKGKRFIDLRDK
jgi:phenylacetate-CoA ligase